MIIIEIGILFILCAIGAWPLAVLLFVLALVVGGLND